MPKSEKKTKKYIVCGKKTHSKLRQTNSFIYRNKHKNSVGISQLHHKIKHEDGVPHQHHLQLKIEIRSL